jgi:hypothetical protein
MTFTFNVPIEVSNAEVALKRAEKYTITKAYENMVSFNMFNYTITDEQFNVLIDTAERFPNPAEKSPWKRPGYTSDSPDYYPPNVESIVEGKPPLCDDDISGKDSA